MTAYSLELTIEAGQKAAKVFRAIKQFDGRVVMGPTLQLLRESRPLEIEFDRPGRAETLRRLVELLDELDKLDIPYQIAANNVPRSSHLWQPSRWSRQDVVAALESAELDAEKRSRALEMMKNIPPERPSPARELFERRHRDLGYGALLPSEQTFLKIRSLQAEVYDGGFHQYFYNSAGDHAMQTLDALEALGALQVRTVLAAAIQLLKDGGGYSPHCDRRRDALSPLAEDAFIALNSSFHETSEDAVGMAFALVEADYKAAHWV